MTPLDLPPVPFIRRRCKHLSPAELADAEARFARVLRILIDVAINEQHGRDAVDSDSTAPDLAPYDSIPPPS